MASNLASGTASSSSRGDGDQNLEDKKNLVTDKLQKREEERLDLVQKRRDEKEKESAVDEDAQLFTVNFARESNAIERDLKLCDSVKKSELPAYFDRMSVGVQNLQKSLSDATLYLPAYDVQHTQETIIKLQVDIHNKRGELLPKKKFAFKSKKKTLDKLDRPASGKTGASAEERNADIDDMTIELADCKFVDRNGEMLGMSGNAIKMKDVALARLSDCRVKLQGSPSAVHIRALKNCHVFCGPVSGSIFITDCSNCVFVLSCQQLRIHTTTESKFYIHVTSRAIIEDTTRVEFAPYNWKYDGLDDDYNMSGLDLSRNNWAYIDDFNWLASDQHSPNWSLIDEKDRVQAWDV
ncbi:tubulin-specific chaperone C-like [Liolophura sinensis]|uniref:tubulin-specific chaperone C-like n=1 Tax=Liolophura sinensis TaxID=3198878 RepID=UPI003158EA76